MGRRLRAAWPGDEVETELLCTCCYGDFVSCFSLSVSFGMASGKFFSFVFVVYDS